MRICVKVGGALVETAAGRARLAGMLQRAKAQEHECILVHGGGKQIREVTNLLGLEEKRHEGLRITDAMTARAVSWVLAGEVNKSIVAALAETDLRAVGLCGADLGLFHPRRKKASVDLGYVGTLEPSDVDARALTQVLTAGIVPVIATIGPERDAASDAPFLNVNADEAAGPIAAAFGCDTLVLLSDIAGVLDKTGALITHVDRQHADKLIEDGTIQGGMIPKIRAALDACVWGVSRVRICAGSGDFALQDALDGEGTLIELGEGSA